MSAIQFTSEMINRRNFFQLVTGVALSGTIPSPALAKIDKGRSYWIQQLTKIAEPVLTNLAAGTLKKSMPVECRPGKEQDRRQFTYLEAIARLLSGMAPWLEADLPSGAERALQDHYAELARAAIRSATDPTSPDFLNFDQGKQPLVDCGFLGLAVMRAPNALWKKLDSRTQQNLISALTASRIIIPPYNNWLLFSASVEAALALMGARWDGTRIDYAIHKHNEWYVGDGVYGDGPHFHWDYYNSFVIQPMLLEVLKTIGQYSKEWEKLSPDALLRAKRYAAIQERLISPEGSFPAIGRSITYRTGAFHLLAHTAWTKQLPEAVTPAQVRCALTAVMEQLLEAEGTFDKNGWLQIGLRGHQPHLGEEYISTGSLYLCAAIFLPLGLAPQDSFWTEPHKDWSSRQIWAGENLDADHAL